jgi:hypothetical protein
MDPSSMMGGMGGGGGGGIGGVLGGYGQGVAASQAAQHGGPPPLQMQSQQPFRQNQPGPTMIPMQPTRPAQVTQQPQQQTLGINNDADPDDMSHGITAARGTAAGNAARQSSLQTAINNFHAAQALSAQSTPAETQQKPATQSQLNLAQLAQRVQSDTAMETAAQSSQNPNTQWASQQPVNPANVQDMNDAEDYVNQNAYTPAGLFGGNGG